MIPFPKAFDEARSTRGKGRGRKNSSFGAGYLADSLAAMADIGLLIYSVDGEEAIVLECALPRVTIVAGSDAWPLVRKVYDGCTT